MRNKKTLVKRDGKWFIDIVTPSKSASLDLKATTDYIMVYSLVGHELDDNDKEVDREYGSFYLYKDDAYDHLKAYNKGYERCFITKRLVNLNKVVVDNKARKWIHLVPTKRYAFPIDVA